MMTAPCGARGLRGGMLCKLVSKATNRKVEQSPAASLCLAMQKLVYVDDSLPRVTRRRAGKGWANYDPAERRRLSAIGLPPAYIDAWLCPVPNGQILATGKGSVKLKDMLAHVSDHLGNTPAIARSSYIHPAVIAQLEGQEEWRKNLRLPRSTRWQTRTERGLIAFLEECGTASEFLQLDAA
jgi:DNA topoisomerase IB